MGYFSLPQGQSNQAFILKEWSQRSKKTTIPGVAFRLYNRWNFVQFPCFATDKLGLKYAWALEEIELHHYDEVQKYLYKFLNC